MKAFWMDEETVWAAETLDDAKIDYATETGEVADDDFVREVTDEELDRPMPETDEDEMPTGVMTTLRRYLDEMKEAGFLACTP